MSMKLKFDPILKKTIDELYHQDKLTMEEVGEKLNFTLGQTRIRMVQWNIPIRNKSEVTKLRHKLHPQPYLCGKDSCHWQGGRVRRPDGYIYIYQPNHPNSTMHGNYVLEHRLVMEKKIGRYLERWEIVHHINGMKDDNRAENLELLPRNIDNFAMDKLLQENNRLKKEIKKLKKVICDLVGGES